MIASTDLVSADAAAHLDAAWSHIADAARSYDVGPPDVGRRAMALVREGTPPNVAPLAAWFELLDALSALGCAIADEWGPRRAPEPFWSHLAEAASGLKRTRMLPFLRGCAAGEDPVVLGDAVRDTLAVLAALGSSSPTEIPVALRSDCLAAATWARENELDDFSGDWIYEVDDLIDLEPEEILAMPIFGRFDDLFDFLTSDFQQRHPRWIWWLIRANPYVSALPVSLEAPVGEVVWWRCDPPYDRRRQIQRIFGPR